MRWQEKGKMEQKTNFLQFACRMSGDDVDALVKQNGLTPQQKSTVRTMMAYLIQHMKIHVYYKQRKENEILAVMTLGKACDAWCESFLDTEQLWKGYMADQIAMRGLMSGYEVFRKVIEKQYNTAVSPLHFWDEEADGLRMDEIICELAQDEIVVGKSRQMNPLKSVLFTVTILSDEKGAVPAGQTEKGLCNGCNNVGCPNRVTDEKDTQYK